MSDWASPTAQSVRHLVYQTFAQQGRAASPAELAGELELDPAHVLDALRELHDRHALVLTPAGDAIRMAHPFSAAPMGFVVRAADQFWWGGCAWIRSGLPRRSIDRWRSRPAAPAVAASSCMSPDRRHHRRWTPSCSFRGRRENGGTTSSPPVVQFVSTAVAPRCPPTRSRCRC